MRVIMGADHAGFVLKEHLKKVLEEQGHEVKDVGCFDTDEVDYPDLAEEVALGISQGQWERGMLVCGTGIGMDISANKVSGVRAARVTDTMSAQLSRAHNDANVLCLSGWMTGPKLAEEILQIWLQTAYDGERHDARLSKISRLEGGQAAEGTKET